MVFYFLVGTRLSLCIFAFHGPTDGGQNDLAVVWRNTGCLDYMPVVFPVHAIGRILLRGVFGKSKAAFSTGVDTSAALGDRSRLSSNHPRQSLEAARW